MRVVALVVAFAVGACSSHRSRSIPPEGYRAQEYHGVVAYVPTALSRRVRSEPRMSDCDALFLSGVYEGALYPGKCAVAIDPGLLSVSFSPLDEYTSRLGGAFVMVKNVTSKRVAVVVWYGSKRAAEAATILASVRQG
jgi:hypothetical protein